MSINRVRKHLKNFGLENRIMEFEVSSATVHEASLAVGSSEAEIAKTLSFLVGEQPILIVVAGDMKIDNHKFKDEFQTKAKMLAFEEVEKLIGYGVGGVCPFAVNDGVSVFLDESLKRFEFVYPAAGTSSSAVKLTISELEQTSNYTKWVDVCKSIIV